MNFQDGMTCGGAYMKLLADTEDMSLENFHDRTPYSIMFGPDKCGLTSKVCASMSIINANILCVCTCACVCRSISL